MKTFPKVLIISEFSFNKVSGGGILFTNLFEDFPEKNIAGVVSQVLILGSIDKEGKVILVHPSQKSENGLPIA